MKWPVVLCYRLLLYVFRVSTRGNKCRRHITNSVNYSKHTYNTFTIVSFTFATQFSMLPSVKWLFDFLYSVDMAKTDFFSTVCCLFYFIYLFFFSVFFFFSLSSFLEKYSRINLYKDITLNTYTPLMNNIFRMSNVEIMWTALGLVLCFIFLLFSKFLFLWRKMLIILFTYFFSFLFTISYG